MSNLAYLLLFFRSESWAQNETDGPSCQRRKAMALEMAF
jgi:hypothetical protein